MASSLTTIPKIAAVLGMMGSAHDGEVLAAARTAERLRAKLGVSWEHLLTNPPVDAPQRPETSSREEVDPLAGRDWRLVAAACSRHGALLNDWEAGFVSNLHSFPRLSPRQRETLAKIVIRLRAAGCAV